MPSVGVRNGIRNRGSRRQCLKKMSIISGVDRTPLPPKRASFFNWGAMPTSDTPAVLPLATIKPPRCAMCRARMELASREPGANGAEKHFFKCPKCEFSKTKISGDAVNAGRHRPPRKR